MSWDRIGDKWKDLNGSVVEHWDDLTEEELDNRIREMFRVSGDEAEPDLNDWQQRVK